MVDQFNIDKKVAIEITATTLIFSFVLFGALGFYTVLANIFGFIAILEGVMMLTSFVMNDKHALRIRYIVDGTIAFFLRDLILVFTEQHLELKEKAIKLGIVLIIIVTLFVIRYMSIKFSPSKEEEKEKNE